MDRRGVDYCKATQKGDFFIIFKEVRVGEGIRGSAEGLTAPTPVQYASFAERKLYNSRSEPV